MSDVVLGRSKAVEVRGIEYAGASSFIKSSLLRLYGT
jgi:hypothetical protein